MKKILLISSILAAGLTAQVFAAKYSVSVFLDARVGGYIVGGGSTFDQFSTTVVTLPDGTTTSTNTTSAGKAIGIEADKIDDSEIIFRAEVDNVEAQVKFERQATTDTRIKFDSAYVQVNDIFGLLTIRFFDWDYAAGGSANEGEYILADIGFQGFYGSIKPIDILSLGFGFGINADSIRGIRLDMKIGGPVPTDILLGFVVNSSDNEGGEVQEGTIERLQVGFESKLYGDYLKLGFGITPLGSTLQYYETTSTTASRTGSDGMVTNDVTFAQNGDVKTDDPGFVIDLSGSASFLDGLFSLGYGIQFSYDTLTKLFAANYGAFAAGTGTFTDTNGVEVNINIVDDVKNVVFPDNHSYQSLFNDGTDLIEMIAVVISPAVTIGQFTFGLPIKYELHGTTYSGVKLRDNMYHRFELDPQVTWRPAKGIYIQAILGLDMATLANGISQRNLGGYTLPRVGPGPSFSGDFSLEDVFGELRIGASFGISSEE